MRPRTGGQGQLDDGDFRRRILLIAELRVSGAIDLMLRHFAADVVVRRHCADDGFFLPDAARGKAAFRQQLRHADTECQPLNGEVVDILVENENAAVRSRTSWRHTGSGLTRTLDMAHFLCWRNGLIVEVHEYWDDGAMAPMNLLDEFLSY